MDHIRYKRKYHVDLRDVDFHKELRLSVLFGYFQDIASLAADELGVGIDTLQNEHGVAWVLTKIRVDVDRMPQWDEEITIETWPLEPGKLDFNRDYIVRDKDGKSMIRAISSWVIMDIKERKLKRVQSLPFSFPTIIEERAIQTSFKKLKQTGPLETAYTKKIGYSDIDFNGHLNNSKYIDYIMDCFDIKDHQNYVTSSIEVNFTKEALPGDILLWKKDISEMEKGHIYIEGINEKDQRTVCKAILNIKKQDENEQQR